MASIENSKANFSRTGCQPVPNARAARSTIAARCTGDSVAFHYEFPDAMATASEHFFSRFAQTDVHTRNLPHWASNDVLIFITYRLADSLPATKLREWQAECDEWERIHPEPWDEKTTREYYEIFPGKLETMVDAGYGSCILLREDCRKIVVENLLHFNEDRYKLHSFVVMSNHVHVLTELKARDQLSKILHSWKSYTAKRINEVVGGSGEVWQKEYYDRLIRDSVHYERMARYIRKNAEVVEGVNARASSCTENSRTGCQPVQG